MTPDPRTDVAASRVSAATRAGLITLAIGAVLIFAPLVLGRGMLNKYIVAAGFLGACLGLAMMLNALLDRFSRGR